MDENKNLKENYSPLPVEKESEKSSWKEFLKFTIIALAIVIPFRLYVAQPFIVSGASMSPTFETGQYLIVDEISYRFESPKRGDVVILEKPGQESEFLIKRIVGLPGETIVIKDGSVSVKNSENPEGFAVPENYVKNRSAENLEVKAGENEYFVMGDNRPVSLDSRFIGMIPKDNIVGRAVVRLFPLGTISLFPGNYQ